MKRLMLAISDRGPRVRLLVDSAAMLARQLEADWFVVHVRQPSTLHYRMPATEHPVPEQELDYAKRLGAQVIIENGRVKDSLISFARKMSINYFVAGRSFLPWFSFPWRLPLAQDIQRRLPQTIVMII